jgi:hypothetical protein
MLTLADKKLRTRNLPYFESLSESPLSNGAILADKFFLPSAILQPKKVLNLETRVAAQRLIKDLGRKRSEKRQIL